MARFEESMDLFGRDVGNATLGNIACGWCGTEYLDREDAEGNPYPLSEALPFIRFGDLTVVECCFEKVEEAVFSRIDDIIPWFTRILMSDSQVLRRQGGMIVGLYEVLSDLCPR